MEEFHNAVRTQQPTKCNMDQAIIEAVSVESNNQKRQVRWDRAKEAIV
jgi:hypothetical protein